MSKPRIPKPSKPKNPQARDDRWALEIDQLIADINVKLPKVLWFATVLGTNALGGPAPSIEVNRDRSAVQNRDVVEYFDQSPSADLECEQYVEKCRSFAKRAGRLAGETNPEVAEIFWFDCLFQSVPRFRNVTEEGKGWVNDFPGATIQLLLRLKRAGSMSGLTAATLPIKPDRNEAADQATFDLNNPQTEPYVYQPFPTTVYHHATKRNKLAADQEALDAALAEGWKHEPPPAEPATGMPVSLDDQAIENRRRPGRPRSTPDLHSDVKPYLDRVSKAAGRRINVPDFCLVAVDSSDDTYFGFWRRGDPRCPELYAKRFERTLAMSPEQFLGILKQRTSTP